jgi:cellulose biosynthesis protein BcsQ
VERANLADVKSVERDLVHRLFDIYKKLYDYIIISCPIGSPLLTRETLARTNMVVMQMVSDELTISDMGAYCSYLLNAKSICDKIGWKLGAVIYKDQQKSKLTIEWKNYIPVGIDVFCDVAIQSVQKVSDERLFPEQVPIDSFKPIVDMLLNSIALV